MPLASPEELLPDRLVNAGPGEPVDAWIYSAFPKDNWQGRKAADFTHAEHPGTAIRIGNDLFEIVAVEETGEPGLPIRYGLKKWDARHAVRQIIPFTAETQAEAAADYLDEKHKQVLRQRVIWFFPFAGLAPDPLQRQWENDTARNMTVVSAASAVATIFIFLGLTSIFGRSPSSKLLLYFTEYLGFESFARLLWIVFSGKPHGSLLLTFPYLIWEALVHPERRAGKKEKWLTFSYENDEVIRRPGGAPLEVRSMLFDDMLAGPHPIRFEDAVYKPVSWHEEGKGLGRRVIYVLQRIDADPKARYREYTHPRKPERQKAVEAFTRNRERTEIFALLWGTYPRVEQLRLEAKYHFAAAKWTATTAGFLLAGSVVQIWISAILRASVIAYGGPVYLIFESAYRIYRAKVDALPAGSVVGYVFRLFFHAPP